MLCVHAFRQLISVGHLTLIGPDGNRYDCRGADGPRATIRIGSPSLDRRIMFNPELAIGEGYMDGSLSLEDGTSLYDLLDLCMANISGARSGALRRFLTALRGVRAAFRHWNPVHLAQRKVAHHYDLSDALFDLFLDHDRQYSCGYFLDPDDDLETAQWNKKLHLAAKLNLKPGQRLLDIGSGWGGLGLFLATIVDDLQVDGVTLSREQHAVSNRRAEEAGLADRVRFHLKDYRRVEDRFDRIVSVGMFEHVGVPYYDQYFGKVKELLKEDGLALIHSIGHVGPPNYSDPWMVKYIFPGGYSPALSEMVAPVDKHYLVLQDIEVLRMHYSKTLGHWHDRFMEKADKARALYDDRFVRMWEYYLLAMEAAFRDGSLLVYQVQIGKTNTAAPITRDYLYPYHGEEADRHGAFAEAAE